MQKRNVATRRRTCAVEIRTKDTNHFHGSRKNFARQKICGKRSNRHQSKQDRVCLSCCKICRIATWWTCAELNCGLTRFFCGHYTLSRWLISLRSGSSTNRSKAYLRNSSSCGGDPPQHNVPYSIDARDSAVGNGKRTGLNSLSRKSYTAGSTCSRSSAFFISI